MLKLANFTIAFDRKAKCCDRSRYNIFNWLDINLCLKLKVLNFSYNWNDRNTMFNSVAA